MMRTGDSRNKTIKIAHKYPFHFRKYRSYWTIWKWKQTGAATVAEWRQRQQIEM